MRGEVQAPPKDEPPEREFRYFDKTTDRYTTAIGRPDRELLTRPGPEDYEGLPPPKPKAFGAMDSFGLLMKSPLKGISEQIDKIQGGTGEAARMYQPMSVEIVRAPKEALEQAVTKIDEIAGTDI